MDEMRTRIGISHERQCGSVGLKIGLIAAAEADVYVDPSGFTSAWDICGAEAILRGAGGRLTDLTGQPIVYGIGDLRNRKGLVATNGACHEHLLAAITPVVKAVLNAQG